MQFQLDIANIFALKVNCLRMRESEMKPILAITIANHTAFMV